MLRATLVTPLTGPLAGYGRAGAHALALWTRWAESGGPVELDVIDAHPDPVAAARQAERARPDVLFGPYGSGPALAVIGATDRLVFNHGGARIPAGDRAGRVVSILAPADRYFRGALRAVRHADPAARTLCLATAPTGFGRAVGDGAVDEAQRLGFTVARRGLTGRDRDPARPGAAVLLVAGSFAAELAIARDLLPGRWRAAGFVGAGVAEVLADLGTAREGLLGPAQWLASAAPRPDEGPPVKQFVAAYRRRTGDDPPYPAAQAFAAGLIARRCLAEAGAADDAALLAAARDLRCTTLFGRFRLDPHTGLQVGHRVLTVQWQHGVRVVVWPPEQAGAALRYPLR